MAAPNAQAQLAAAVAEHALKAVEQQIDNELEKLDQLDTGDLAALRAKRLKELQDKQKKTQEWRQKGHGKYEEVHDQKDWFNEVKNNERVICHFYRPSTWRCEIVDKHLGQLAAKHIETRFLKIDAEKSTFLCERLNIVVLPTIFCAVDGKSVDMIEGFDSLGGTDKFTTETLEKRLAVKGAIDFDDSETAAERARKQYANKSNKFGAAIYEGTGKKQIEEIDDAELDALSDDD